MRGDEQPIYLDNQASTPVDPRVLDVMLPHLQSAANPASTHHRAGQSAAAAVDAAREQVAGLLGAAPDEIVFTSGATESNNLALKGVALGPSGVRRVLATAIDHPSVLRPAEALADQGCEVHVLPVDGEGFVDRSALRRAVSEPSPTLVSIGLANNEIGTVQDLGGLSRDARALGCVVVHADAAQAIGKVPVDVDVLGVDLLSLSGHKVYGPQGIGALYVRRSLRSALRAQLDGGGQERGLRSGTTNVAGCVGLGVACAIAAAERDAEAARIVALGDRLLELLRRGEPDLVVNGPVDGRRLPGNVHVTFRGVEADAVMAACPGLSVSAGSACSSGAPGMSHVLRAIGLSEKDGESSLRLGLGRFTTEAEVERAATLLVAAVRDVRARMSSGARVAA